MGMRRTTSNQSKNTKKMTNHRNACSANDITYDPSAPEIQIAHSGHAGVYSDRDLRSLRPSFLYTREPKKKYSTSARRERPVRPRKPGSADRAVDRRRRQTKHEHRKVWKKPRHSEKRASCGVNTIIHTLAGTTSQRTVHHRRRQEEHVPTKGKNSDGPPPAYHRPRLP